MGVYKSQSVKKDLVLVIGSYAIKIFVRTSGNGRKMRNEKHILSLILVSPWQHQANHIYKQNNGVLLIIKNAQYKELEIQRETNSKVWSKFI